MCSKFIKLRPDNDQRSDCSYIVHKVSQNNSLDSLRAASAVTVYGEKTAGPMFQLNYGHEHWVTTEKARIVNASDQSKSSL